MKRFILCFLILFPLPSWGAIPPAASDSRYDEFEGLELAEALARDGKGEDAVRVVDRLPTAVKARENNRLQFVYARAHALAGQPDAVIASLKPLVHGLDDEMKRNRHLLLAQAYADLKIPHTCARHFELARLTVVDGVDRLLAYNGCLKSAGLWRRAWSFLISVDPGEHSSSLFRERLEVLIQLGLPREAFATALRRLRRSDASAAEALAHAEILAPAGHRLPQAYLEVARLRFPREKDLILALVPLYHGTGHARATADLFARAATLDRTYAYHAAENHRQLGHRLTSNWWGSQISDESEQIKQRIAGLVDLEAWVRIASSEQIVGRAGLRNDDEVAYAVAYSLALFGRAGEARNYLRHISDPKLVARALSLSQSLKTFN